MAFDIRCPECQAKLRLDEAPDPSTPIECPRCGSQFAAPGPVAVTKPARKEKPAAGKKAAKKPGGPKKRKAKKKKTNVAILFAAIGLGFAGLIGVGFLMVYFLNRAGKVEEMLAYVPESCNWARGVNVGQLAKYPGYKGEVDKYMTPAVKAAADEAAKACGQDPDTFVDYLVVARNVGGGRGATMYVFRTKKSFNPDELGKNLPGATAQGDRSYRMPGKSGGVLSGATVALPTNRLVVVAPASLPPAQGGKSRDGSFAAHLDTTARLVMRGSIWLIVRSTGGLKGYPSATTGAVADDLKTLHEKAKSATTFGLWTTPGGGGVRIGAGMQCASPGDASELVKAMREGPLGKGDESEPTNQLKTAFQLASDKKAFGEFMQYLSYRSTKDCAYLVSKLDNIDNAKRFMDLLNNPNMGTGESGSFGGGGGFGPPGGGPEGGGRGLPGGVAPPGMNGP